MVAIVPSNPYQKLTRRIGYSVGLEFLRTRILQLVDLYVDEKAIGLAAWRRLVREKFNREVEGPRGRKTAGEHIGEVFGALNLLRMIGREIYPLPGLECLSIIKRFLKDETLFTRAFSIVMSQLVIEADGEIFLNCLASSFVAEKAKQLLEKMIQTKRESLATVISNPALQRKIFEFVSIKQQSKFRTGDVRSSFGKRLTPLSGKPDTRIDISEDYLKKTLTTRKGWAMDLGLFNDHRITQRGEDLRSALSELGLGPAQGPFIFWPYEVELAALKIGAEQMDSARVSRWNLLVSIAKGLYGASQEEFIVDFDYAGVLDELAVFHELYREGSSHKGTIRHQLPLYIAQPCVAAVHTARDGIVPPLPKIIDKEIRGQSRRIDLTHIRGTEGALVFRISE
jgi:hypothetical protein